MSGHTAWPQLTDVTSVVTAMGGSISVGTSIQQTILDGVISTVHRKTHRTFIPETEVRYFNGNDSGEIEIDEFITISTIELIGWFGITTGLELANFAPIENRPGFPNTRIQIYRGSVPAWYRHWVDRFPSGRQNLKISATWGYDTTIPDDLWYGVLAQTTGALINIDQAKNTEVSKGFLIKWSEADVTEVRNQMDPFKFLSVGAGGGFRELLRTYKRPDSYYFRKRTRVLV